ncbi:MAG: hypothetical protein AB7N24_12455 [Dehalococcoidia bacterium]
MTEVEPGTPELSNAPDRPEALKSLFDYPFMSALQERRTRRVAQGVSIDAGALSHQSMNKPLRLTPLEEAILIVITGITGMTTHDGPLRRPDGGPELGTPFLHAMGRSASSADNCQPTSFFMINDDGIFLIKRPEPREMAAILRNLPPRWNDWSESDWLSVAEAVKVKIYNRRLEFPRKFPYYLGWNKQHSNVPGTTIFFPVVDLTRQAINVYLILLSEPDGQRPFAIDDWRPFKPKGIVEWLAWAGQAVGLTEKIPYQPVGGLSRIRSGWSNREQPAPLGYAQTMRTDQETFLLMQNLMLTGHSMGLGGWIHASVFPPYVLQRDPAKDWYGIGFRFQEPEKRRFFRHLPPVPSTQPNPVGIDGILEGLCPPYIRSMDDAVEQVLEEKYGAAGAYGDKEIFARSYKGMGNAEEFLRNASHHPKEAIEYTKVICRYIHETYGRFPAHTDAFHVPGTWVQFSHVEMEYYENFYDPSLYRRQAQHAGEWGH